MCDFWKQLFCKHDYTLSRWHWTHGINGNEPREMECEYICTKCGKFKWTHPDRNSAREKYILDSGIEPYKRIYPPVDHIVDANKMVNEQANAKEGEQK
jgi:hypothetical protein